ncbi:MAG: GNAT family N-acetyltransferase [Actinomycetes bacterium]
MTPTPLDDDADHPALVVAPRDVTVRRASPADVAAVTALYNACSVERLGVALWDEEDVRQRWLDADRLGDTLLVERGGRLVAYAEFAEDHDPWSGPAGEVDLYTEGRVAPDARGEGLGRFLLARALDRAARAATRAPEAARVAMRTTLLDADDEARAWFARHGFVPVRFFLELRTDLGVPPPAPVLPPDVRITAYRPGADDDDVREAYDLAFCDHHAHLPASPGDWRRLRLERDGFDPSLWLVARDEADEVVGVLLGRAGIAADPELGYVEDLGVVPARRREGIALALLRSGFAAFRARGLRRVGLDVDDVTLEGAMRLYARAGMQVVRRTDVFELELRAGG